MREGTSYQPLCPVAPSRQGRPNPVLKELELRIRHVQVLFEKNDLVSDGNVKCVRRVRVAFEHENHFNSGLFQEVCHLLIIDCDLRVLIAYPENEDELNRELENLHKLITGSHRSKQISETGSFLFIVDTIGKTLEKWQAYVYRSDDWQQLTG